MSAARIAPRLLIAAMLAIVGVRLALSILGVSEGASPWGGPIAILRLMGKVAAYSIALPMCLGIASEYRRQQLLRMAWIFMALHAALSIVRYLFDTQLIEAFHPGYWHSQTITVLRELPAAVSLFFLAAGIAAMAIAFFRTRLGFSLHKTDMAAIGGAVVFLLVIFYFRNDVSTVSRLQSVAARAAQFFSDIFFALAAAGAIVLHRFAKQMGGGQLALTMDWLIADVATRAALIVISALLVRMTPLPHANLVQAIIYDCTPWMFAAAAAYRHGIAFTATRQAAEWGVHRLRGADAAQKR